MTRTKTPAVPSYRLHRARGQAIVTLSGRMFYLGPYGSPESHERYNEVVAQWLANGRRWPAERPQSNPPTDFLVCHLILDYWGHAQQYYVKNDLPTSEQGAIRSALRSLRRAFGRLPAREFTALKLQELREVWIQHGLARTTINQNVSRVRRMFRWGVSQELVPPSTFESLRSVSGLKKGRTSAREKAPVTADRCQFVR